MSVFDFSPAITSLNLYTSKDSPGLILNPKKENSLYISCTIGGLTRRTLKSFHDELDYLAVHFTLLHQFGGKETTIVRRYIVEYDPDQEIPKNDYDNIELKIPIDDDFSKLDFVSDYYYLVISFTPKHPGEMGIEESIRVGKIFETKIPFIVTDEV